MQPTTTNSQQQTIQQILNTKYNDYIQYLNLCHDGYHSDGSVGTETDHYVQRLDLVEDSGAG